MPKYIVSYYAILDAHLKVWGMLRVSGMYNPDEVKTTIETYYRTKFPRKKEMAITILSIEKVSQEEYDHAANSSLGEINNSLFKESCFY